MTGPLCSLSGVKATPLAGSPVLAFHSRVVQSHELEAMYSPSGENETEVTRSAWPSKGFSAASPVLTFQSQIVRSFEPEARCFPSGENEIDVIEPVCPSNGLNTMISASTFQS